MTLPRLAGLMGRFHLSFLDRSLVQSAMDQRTSLVVHKTKDGRWCWELVDEQGQVHGRSTAEFVRQEQAAAAAALVQCLIADSIITDREGREIKEF
ncbi:MAG: hypothetical protein EOO81_00800 [Oxalobacteraceae bacterium]|nr:MAG: hypothetical protein EOO81_00800 [Oxalobacteraceae bacterium]